MNLLRKNCLNIIKSNTMPLDVDYIVATTVLKELDEILNSVPHGERQKIADDYIEFLDQMREKYLKTKAEVRNEKIEKVISS